MEIPHEVCHPVLVRHGTVVAGVVSQLTRDGLPWPMPDWDWEVIVGLVWLLDDAGMFSGRELIARCRGELLP